TIDLPSPSFTDRVVEAQGLVAGPDLTPDLDAAGRALLADTLSELRRAIVGRGVREQLLHGEPHPGNVLAASEGVLFIDLETCCRGPVEFDVAHLPESASEHYPDIDDELLSNCRHLVLAMVAAWRWDRADQIPDRERQRERLMAALRRGPPWRTLDDLSVCPIAGPAARGGQRHEAAARARSVPVVVADGFEHETEGVEPE